MELRMVYKCGGVCNLSADGTKFKKKHKTRQNKHHKMQNIKLFHSFRLQSNQRKVR